MTKASTAGRILFALGFIGFGALSIAYAELMPNWAPIPENFPARTEIAYVVAVLMVAGGASLLLPRPPWWCALGVAMIPLASVLLLHTPIVLAAPTNVGAWLGWAETFALACAACVLAARLGGPTWSEKLGVAARYGFAACPLVFGAAHFAYPQFTADFIPSFMPARLFFAYLTGAAHVAAGLSMLSGVLARLSSKLLGAMFAGFIALVHIPRVAGDLSSRAEWTFLCVAFALCGAAWIVAGDFAARHTAKASA